MVADISAGLLRLLANSGILHKSLLMDLAFTGEIRALVHLVFFPDLVFIH